MYGMAVSSIIIRDTIYIRGFALIAPTSDQNAYIPVVFS